MPVFDVRSMRLYVDRAMNAPYHHTLGILPANMGLILLWSGCMASWLLSKRKREIVFAWHLAPTA